MKKVKPILPEVYLIISALFYWYSSTFYNPLAFVLIAVFIYQLLSQNKITGLIISFLFICINLYLTLALLSELSEFTTRNNKWETMFIVGSVYIGLNIIVGIIMFIKYLKLLIDYHNNKTITKNTIS